jgi:Tol biopolymer transport system component
LGELKFGIWDADANGTVDEREASRLIAIAYGTRSADGTLMRSTNGRVLFSSWIRGADKDGNLAVSRAEFIASFWLTPPERARLFNDLDENQDQELSYGEMLKSPSLNVDVLGMFLAYDKDLDGLLTTAELFGNASSGATKQHAALSLEACDDDHDGKLSLGEYMLAPAGSGYVTIRLFDRKDADNDGFLGWKEFYTEQSPVLIGLAWELFRRFDRNHDGRLGLDEFQFTVDAANVPPDVVFRIKDSNRDGRLVLTEVFAQPEPTTGNPHELERYRFRLARATDKFRKDDTDGNGSLDLAEFTRARQAAAVDLQEKPGEYSTRLFIADSDGSNMKQLTDLPEFQKQGSPVWSSDGKFIAFDGWRPQHGENFSSSQVVVVQVDGRNPRVLGAGAMPSFSPGGSRIAFSSPKAGGTWIISREGPEDELIQVDQTAWGTDWSPDGRLAYSVNTPGGANLVIFNLVEGSTDFLFDKEKSPYRQIFWNMAWSPNGKRIAFKGLDANGKEGMGIVDTRGEKFGFIKRFEGPILASFAWSPIESRILFVKQDPDTRRYQIYFVDPDTKDPPQLLPGQDDLRDYSDVAYSPDGKKIVFSCHRRTSPE